MNIPTGWSHSDARGGCISRSYVFADFLSAFEFMTAMAAYSESVDHHPEWTNVYNRVEITLTTHDAGGLTEKDMAWARQANLVGAA